VYITFLRNHLNFQNFVCFGQTPTWFLSTKLWIPKKLYEHVRSCIILKEKGETHSWFRGWRLCLVCYLHEMATKMKARYESTRKHMVLFNKKGSFDRENLVALWAKLPTRLKQVKTDMIKQKTIIGQASSFHFGKSPLRLASPQQLL
jgi:hypothetical protein